MSKTNNWKRGHLINIVTQKLLSVSSVVRILIPCDYEKTGFKQWPPDACQRHVTL